MADKYSIEINFTGNTSSEGGKISDTVSKLKGRVTELAGSFDKLSAKIITINQAAQGVQSGVAAFEELSRAGLSLNTSITDLSALTGIAGEKLNEIEKYARSAAKTFGGSAAQSVESYKLILSQLGPAIADVPSALAAMGRAVSTLSKTMGNDTVAATTVLTTAMNQFGVSLEDPAQATKAMESMMNVMAAAAKEGSAELPAISEALRQSGMAAKAAGVSFEETNAAIQILDKSGRKASEGGISLRNVIATLSTGRFLPKETLEELSAAGVEIDALTDTSSSLADRLNQLTPLLGDTALLTKMFGRENANAAMALISNVDNLSSLTGTISGTMSAYDQAGKVMDSVAEKQSRSKAVIEDVQIAFFNLTKNIQPFAGAISSSLVPISQMIPLLTIMASAIKTANLAIGKGSAYVLKAILGHNLYMASLRKLTVSCGSVRTAATLMHGALLGIAGIAITGIILAIGALAKKTKEAKEEALQAKEAQKAYSQSVSDVKVPLDVYKANLKAIIDGHGDEKGIVEELNTSYGNIFGTYDTAAQWYDVLIKKSDEYVRLKINEAKVDKLAAESAEAELKLKSMKSQRETTPEWKQISRSTSVGGMGYAETVKNPAFEQLEKDIAAEETLLQNHNQTLEDIVKENLAIKNGLSTPIVRKTVEKESDDSGSKEILSEYKKGITDIADTNNALLKSQDTLDEQITYTANTIKKLIPVLGKEDKVVLSLTQSYLDLITAKNRASAANSSYQGKAPDINNMPELPYYGIESVNVTFDEDIDTDGLDNIPKKGAAAVESLYAIGDAMSKLSSVVGEGAASWLSWGANLLQAIAAAIPQIVALTGVQAANATANAEAAGTGAAASVAATPGAGPILAVAAIASVVAAMASIPKFAAGGIAYGPTLGIFGEYSGASNNPEVVAPLSKLKELIAPPAGNAGTGTVRFKIKGRDLIGLVDKINDYDGRVR